MKKKYQINELVDWFYLDEVIEEIRKMKIGDRRTITRLDQSYKEDKKE